MTTPVLRTRNAVFLAFLLNGAVFASFASRVPDIKATLGLSPGELGVTLLAASLGSVMGLPVSGSFVHRFGAARTLVGAALVQTAGLLTLGYAVSVAESRPLAMVGLFFAGIGTGVYDVGMNFEGASVERLMGRSIMPHFHASFSAGTVAAALLGALLSRLEVPVFGHLAGALALLVPITLALVRRFLPRTAEVDPESGEATTRPSMGHAWFERRTLLVGVVVFAAAFTEGVANDWLGVAMADGHGLANWLGVLAFAVFLTAMTAGRLLGTRLLDTRGRIPVLRALFVAAAVGCVLVVYGHPVVAFIGAAIWGVGASLGFPVGMSAASDEPERAAARLSVVSTIGYTAFIGGPPLLGFLGDHVGVLHSLLIVGALALVALAVVPAVRPIGPGPQAEAQLDPERDGAAR